MRKKTIILFSICLIFLMGVCFNANADSTPSTVNVPSPYEQYNSAAVFEFTEEDLTIGEYWIKEYKFDTDSSDMPAFESTPMGDTVYDQYTRKKSNRYACINTFFELSSSYTSKKQPNSNKENWHIGIEDNISISFYTSFKDIAGRRTISYDNSRISFDFVCLDKDYKPVVRTRKMVTNSDTNYALYSFNEKVASNECITSGRLNDLYNKLGVRYLAINIYVGDATESFPWTSIYNELTISLTSLPTMPQKYFDGYSNYQDTYRTGYEKGWETGNLEGYNDGYGNGSAYEYNRLHPVLDEYREAYNSLYDEHCALVQSSFDIEKSRDFWKNAYEELANERTDSDSKISELENKIKELEQQVKDLENVELDPLPVKNKTFFEENKIAIIASSVSGVVLIACIVAVIVYFKNKKD